MTDTDSEDDRPRRKLRAPRLPDHLADGESSALNATSEVDIDRNDPDYDPYDTDKRQRSINAPRMVDMSQPIPQEKPGLVVARPHAPQTRLKPEEIVPDADNHIPFYQHVGMTVMSDKIWPTNPLRNPILVYYASKLRGRIAEDLMGMTPYLLLAALDFYMLFFFFKTPINILAYQVIKIPFLMALCSLMTIATMSAHIRKTMNILPVDEMLMTRLKYHEIAQGISTRPMAIQGFGIAFTGVLQLVLAGILMYHGVYDQFYIIFGILLVVVHHQSMIVWMELGASMALRAHLCIRQSGIASMKSVLDLGFLVFIFIVVMTVLLILSSFIIFISLILGFVSPFIPLAVIATVLLVVSTILQNFLVEESSEVIQWTYRNFEEWWVFEEQEAVEGIGRGLWTPWKSQATQRKINLASFRK